MITVTGTASLSVNYSVDLDMTEDEFESLSNRKQNEILDSAIDWYVACSGADVDDFEIDEIVSKDED